MKPVLLGWLCMAATIVPAAANSAPIALQAVEPGYRFAFPRDHGSHDTFALEWWYVTGHLFASDGRRFGYELTFFRRAIDDARAWTNPSRWAIRQLYVAHLALTDEAAGTFQYAEKISRAGIGKAGASTGTLDTWIDRWVLRASDADPRQWQLRASTDEWAIDLTLTPRKPPVVHGHRGISLKGQEGQASHYYSVTRIQTTGALRLSDEVVPVTGWSWMDHEFGSGELSEAVIGWDWFSLQLDNHHEVMAYWLRRSDGTFDAVSSGTVVFPDGTTRHVTREDMDLTVLDSWTSPESGARYPSRWRLHVRPLDMQVDIVPIIADQELRTSRSTRVTYWEGAVEIAGTMKESPVQGQGYVELTGYAAPLTLSP